MKLARIPVVVILGCTGTGKSKLAIEIGKRIGGEIISADSMQVYKGLDIITNKVTLEERAVCPHHMLDFVAPLSEFSVVEFRNMALPLIDDMKKRNKVPIIVGGTNYYIESLLWEILVDKVRNSDEEGQSSDECHREETRELLKKRQKMQDVPCVMTGSNLSVLTAESSKGNDLLEDTKKLPTPWSASEKSLYERLMEVDPVTAERLHPNDTRKIARSLQIYEQHGIPQSQILEAQQQNKGGSVYGGPLRFDYTCVFWLQCEKDVLNCRLNKRVDGMLEQGLLKELLDFHKEYNQMQRVTERGYTEGIFQSIGFKEFHEFLLRQERSQFDENVMSAESKALLSSCVESMKCVTRRYAKKQSLWIKNRFLARPADSAPNVYGLDATDLAQWEEKVLNEALDILNKFTNGEEPRAKSLPRTSTSHSKKHAKHVCDICDDRIILGEENWEKHLISKSHKWHVKKRRRLTEGENCN